MNRYMTVTLAVLITGIVVYGMLSYSDIEIQGDRTIVELQNMVKALTNDAERALRFGIAATKRLDKLGTTEVTTVHLGQLEVGDVAYMTGVLNGTYDLTLEPSGPNDIGVIRTNVGYHFISRKYIDVNSCDVVLE